MDNEVKDLENGVNEDEVVIETKITELEKKIEKSIFSAYLFSSIPPFISQLTIALLIFIDGLIIGRLLGEEALASLTYVQIVDFFIRGTAQIFSTGAVSVLSALIGNDQDLKYRNLVPSILLYINVILSLLVYAIAIPSVRPLFKLVGARDKVLELSLQYSYVLIYGCPITMFYVSFNLLLLGEGLAKWNMVAGILTTLFDAPLTFILIKYTNLGIKGAAIGSVISIFVACCLSVGLYFTPKTVTKIQPMSVFKEPRESAKLTQKMFFIGIGDAFNYYAFSVTFCLFNYYVSELLKGDDFKYGLSAYGAVGRLYVIFSSLLISFGSLGYLPIVGYFVGSNNLEGIGKATKIAMAVLFSVIEILAIIMLCIRKYLALMFSSNERFIYYFSYCLYMFLPVTGLASFHHILISFGQALGLSRKLTIASVVNNILFQPIMMTVLFFSADSFMWLLSTYIFKDVFAIGVCLYLFWDPFANTQKYMDRYMNQIKSEKGKEEVVVISESVVKEVTIEKETDINEKIEVKSVTDIDTEKVEVTSVREANSREKDDFSTEYENV